MNTSMTEKEKQFEAAQKDYQKDKTMNIWAKLFEVSNLQILVSKETIENEETGTEEDGIVFTAKDNGVKMQIQVSFQDEQARDDVFDKIDAADLVDMAAKFQNHFGGFR